MFASQVTKEIAVPSGTAVIRKLARRALKTAAVEQQRQALADVKALGGLAALEEFKPKPEDKPAEDDDAKPSDPLLLFDAATLCSLGVVSWTRSEDLTKVDWNDVDEDVQDAVATEILKLSRPALFESKAEGQESQKNG